MKIENEMRFAILMNKLKDIGIKYVHVHYEGSGDSGCVEGVEYYSKESMESMSVTYDNLESHQDWGEYGNGTEENLVLDKDDERFLEDWVSSMLLNGIEDWYNNDGGFGHVLIKTYDCSYTIQNSVRIMEVENYTHAGTLSENNMLANGSSY